MRIIQILNSPNWCGATNYCIIASKELVKLGHDVLLLTQPGAPLEKAKQVGILCDDSIRLNHRNPILFVDAIKKMKRIFREFKPDVISAHINEGAWLPGMVASKVCPNALVARIRTDIAEPKGHFINQYVYNHWTDTIIAGSELHKRRCHEILNFPEERISVVYGGVDSDLFKPSNKKESTFRKEIGVSDDEILIGMVARLSPVKGHEIAIQALKELKRTTENVKLVCAAYESERSFAWLKQQAENYGVADKLIIVGRRPDIPAITADLDIGILCSLGSEANTRSGLEYMASGIPFVGTDAGVIPEVIEDGKTGYVLKHGDPHALASALKTLITNKELRLEMGRQGRARIEKMFSAKLFGKAMEEAYEHQMEVMGKGAAK